MHARYYPCGDIAVELTVAEMTECWDAVPLLWFELVGPVGEDLAFDVWFMEQRRKRSERVDALRASLGLLEEVHRND